MTDPINDLDEEGRPRLCYPSAKAAKAAVSKRLKELGLHRLTTVRSRRSAAAMVAAFDAAAQAYAFKGASHPDAWDAITDRYVQAKERLIGYLMEVEIKK